MTVSIALLLPLLFAGAPGETSAPDPGPGAPEGEASPRSAGPEGERPAETGEDTQAPAFAPVGADRPPPSTRRPPASGPRNPPRKAPEQAAVGTGDMAPLPPPPPPVDPATIARGPWRGRGYLRLRVGMMGPLGGSPPGRPNVVAWGGGAEVGWRATNWLSLGVGVEGFPHRRVERRLEIDGIPYREIVDASLTSWELGVVRLHYPLDGRIQPFLDLAGGVSVLGRLPGEEARAGGTARLGVGTDFWVARNLTLAVSLDYRLNAMGDSVGHMLQGKVGLGVHW